ncbi:uncharacterized protein LOC133281612 isoform X1 [Pezoporus flaviventris]|uniref:uncharacterized protein LOC133281612 isoform X1 n=1 Tax=Pezoporus flaviventris TaxID=889875 RepID=UPI002AB0E272|nr:uncharacterized protein LOC133281612 isoform X1 [Pezoporus flaviventris]
MRCQHSVQAPEPSLRDEDVTQLPAASPWQVPRHRARRSQLIPLPFSPFPPPCLAFGSRATVVAGARSAGEGLPSASSPPAPRAKAGGWQKGCLCLVGLRQLREDPCAALAANFPASWHRERLRRHRRRRLGRTDCERERGKKTTNGHMPSRERRGCRCQGASRQRGAKTRYGEERRVWQPVLARDTWRTGSVAAARHGQGRTGGRRWSQSGERSPAPWEKDAEWRHPYLVPGAAVPTGPVMGQS